MTATQSNAKRVVHPKVPVTIITGFLGAGKTTLLNHILRIKGERSIAVIENEFGEVNIDSSLVSENLLEKEDLVSLQNGCVCCSLRKDIVKALATIEHRSRQRAKPVDAVIIETTGLADPAPVAFTFFANPWVASRYKLDSIICLVDAKHLVQHLDDKRSNKHVVNEVVQQIAFADLILLNKTDLLSAEEVAAVECRIRAINAGSTVVHTQLNAAESCPPVSTLLDTNSFSLNKACAVDSSFMDSDSDDCCSSSDEDDDASPSTLEQHSSQRARASEQDSSSQAARAHLDASGEDGERQPKRKYKKMHDLSGIGSVGIVASGALDEYRFNMFMRDLLAEKSNDILRCKGILQIQGYGDTKFVFQGVHETLRYGPADTPWHRDEPRKNQVVFIGYNLDRKAMMESFRSCVWVPLPEGWQEVMDPATRQPYYYHPASKQKTWSRPALSCPRVVATKLVCAKQPASMLPRRAAHEE